MISETVIAGILGGFAAEFLQWFKIRKELHKGIPDWSKNILYWIITLVMVILGGCLVYVYEQSGSHLNLFLAVNIGASAPLLLGTIVDQVPNMNPGSVD